MRHVIDSSKFTQSKLTSTASATAALDSESLKPTFDFGDEAFSLKEMLTGEFFCGNDLEFIGIAESPETAEPGQLVVYRIGACDPAKVISHAMARGAAGILTEQVLPCPLPQCIVGDVELAMASIAAHTLDHPDRQMLTIGVAGSAGKTTTALLISSLLRDMGTRTAYQTDLGDCDGIVQSTSDSTSKSGETLIHWLSEAVDGQCQAAVVELRDDDARHGLYDSVEFDILVVSGSASLSSDFGPSGLQCIVDRLKPTGVVVAPKGDEKALRRIRDTGVQVVTYGVRGTRSETAHADVSTQVIDQSGGMSTLMLTHGDTNAIFETSLCGAAMASNHAAAATVGTLINQSLSKTAESLSRLRTIPGRVQRLSDFRYADVIIDAAGTPDRAASAMRMARSMKGSGQLWCVLAIGENDTPDDLANYGAYLERFSNKNVVTCARSMKDSYLKASHFLLDGVEHCAAIRLVADHQRAIQWATAEAKPNDTILVVGGVSGNNAQSQRTDIQQITEWVEQSRSERDVRSDVAEIAEPRIIKLHK